MRFIHALVPESTRTDVESVLDDEGVDFVMTEEASESDDRYIFHFPLPSQAVEKVLDKLYDAGLEESFIVIGTADAANTPQWADLEERFVEGGDESDTVVPEELGSKARNLNPSPRTYYTMTLLSVLVASVGLLIDSPAVVVGSMVIAPQVGAALTASVGLAFSERRMIIDGVRDQITGLGVAVICAIIFGYAIRYAAFVPQTLDPTTIAQISTRTSPGILALVVGLSAGAAGAIGLATDLPVSLVGVAVAAALIPAAAAIGIGIAWGYPLVAFGAFVLLVLNILSITVSGALAFWYLGYKPADWDATSPLETVRSGSANATLAAFAIILLVTAVIGSAVVGQSAFQSDTTTAVENEIDDTNQAGLELVSVRTEFGDRGLITDSRDVTVTVRTLPGLQPESLSDQLEKRIEEETGRDVSVTVIYQSRTKSQS